MLRTRMFTLSGSRVEAAAVLSTTARPRGGGASRLSARGQLRPEFVVESAGRGQADPAPNARVGELDKGEMGPVASLSGAQVAVVPDLPVGFGSIHCDLVGLGWIRSDRV